MDNATFDILVTARPLFDGSSIQEPSLRHMVFSYYSDRGLGNQARETADAYLAKLKEFIG